MKNKNISSLVSTFLITFLACSFVEAFTYTGFFAKHINIFITIGILVIFIVALIIFRKLYKNIIFEKLILFSTFFLTFVYLVFDTMEKITYPNFVFSHFHLHTYLLLISTIIMAIIFVFNSDKKKLNTYIYLVLTVILLQYLITNIFGITKSNIGFMLKNPKATYDQKMEIAVDKIPYNYAMFIKANTPENATILIPPQGYPWPQTGNVAYFRYFIYPRNLVNGYEKESGIDINKVDYVLIAYGETTISEYGFTNVWPKFDVKGEYIIYWNPETNETWQDKTGLYKYSANEKRERWGLIKIKH